MGETVMVGMSGGVDSSVAAALLMKEGYAVTGATLWLCGKDSTPPSDALDAKAVCDKLNIPHHIFELKKQFESAVIGNFISEYESGNTPNPCIECNRHIKFGEMIEKAESVGCTKIATGHYAVIKQNEAGRYLLYRPADRSKDQTYVLYGLTQRQLSKVVFPLGGLSKAQVRETAAELALINADKPDSQDICFVPNGDYAAFIEKHRGKEETPGDFVDAAGNILGRHKGVIHYTIGQRKGLGIALGKPAFVLSKDAAANRVVLGEDESALFYRRVLVDRLNFIPFDELREPMRLTAKLRYRHTEQPATLYPSGDGQAIIEFDQPQRAPSPGQAAVFYDGDMVVGGGTIVAGIE